MYGETLNIVYYPSKMTDEIFIKFSSLASTKTLADVKAGLINLNELLVDLIKSWDFFEDDEQTTMWPLTAESIARLDMVFKMKCLYAIMGHVRPEAALPQIPS
jgi:hypothetical protein